MSKPTKILQFIICLLLLFYLLYQALVEQDASLSKLYLSLLIFVELILFQIVSSKE